MPPLRENQTPAHFEEIKLEVPEINENSINEP
jgi:hypothetical protein